MLWPLLRLSTAIDRAAWAEMVQVLRSAPRRVPLVHDPSGDVLLVIHNRLSQSWRVVRMRAGSANDAMNDLNLGQTAAEISWRPGALVLRTFPGLGPIPVV